MQSPILTFIDEDGTAHVEDGDCRKYIASGVDLQVSDTVLIVDDDTGMWVTVEHYGKRAGQVDRYPLTPFEESHRLADHREVITEIVRDANLTIEIPDPD